MAIVYKHFKKDTKELFYVGIGKDKKRAYLKRSRNDLWQNIVNKHGYIVEIYKDNISIDEAIQIEIKLIKEFGRKDNQTGILSNMTDGGDGNNNFSKETIDKISNSLKGQIQSEESKRKRIESLKITWANPELRELKRKQSIELHRLGVISLKGKPSKKKGIPFQGDKEKLSKSLKKHYETNRPVNLITLSDDKLLEIKIDCANGIRLNTLAKKHGYSRNFMIRIINENNLKLIKNISITKNELYNLYVVQNFSRKELSIKLNCSVHNVERLLRVNKIKKNETVN